MKHEEVRNKEFKNNNKTSRLCQRYDETPVNIYRVKVTL